MRWLVAVFAALAFVLGAGQARAEEAKSPITVDASLSPDPSNVGDLLTYEITVTYPRDATINLPSVFDLDPLYMASSRESEPQRSGDMLTKVFTFELQHFEAGEGKVPAFELAWVDGSGQVQTVTVPEYAFVVESLLANEVDPQRRPEDPPISLEYPAKKLEMIVGIVAAALFLGAAIAGLVFAFTSGPVRTFAPPPMPAHEQAYAALKELEGGGLLQQREFEEYYVQLTEIAKGYLQGRFGVAALDRTTEELRAVLAHDEATIAPLTAREVLGFLETSDLFKFAGFEPREGEAEDALQTVREMVDRTVPTPERKSPEGKAGGEAEEEPVAEAEEVSEG